MKKSLKLFTFFILIASLFTTTSCLKSEQDDRTEETESTEISNYLLQLTNAGYDVDTTASGMYYVISTEGSGPFPQAGDTCFIEYSGYFINGNLFDASLYHYENGISQIIYQNNDAIEGFGEALGLMQKGTEANFIIPSKLAYGPNWADIIPPYTPLIFAMKMDDIKPLAVE